MSLIDEIAEIESEIFSDAWSAELLRDSFRYDYNHYMVVTADGELISGSDRTDEADGEMIPGSSSTEKTDAEAGDGEGNIAGYIIYSESDVFELQRIAVRESERRKGLADRLMKALLEAVDGRVILEVRSKNVPAIGLYNKYGFNKIGVRKEYYSDPVDDAVIMELVR
ncbi:MAG: GNAT family N-acetyltransferase [Eubacterium sp.]|nr:GNAT family N-acetyltransferase [Eubacterium sp.]